MWPSISYCVPKSPKPLPLPVNRPRQTQHYFYTTFSNFTTHFPRVGQCTHKLSSLPPLPSLSLSLPCLCRLPVQIRSEESTLTQPQRALGMPGKSRRSWTAWRRRERRYKILSYTRLFSLNNISDTYSCEQRFRPRFNYNIQLLSSSSEPPN